MILRNLARKITSLPWKFNDFDPIKLNPIPKPLEKIINDHKDTFADCYSMFLEALVANDTDYLEKVCTRKFFHKINSSLKEINSKNFKLVLVDGEEPPEIECYNEKMKYYIPSQNMMNAPDDLIKKVFENAVNSLTTYDTDNRPTSIMSPQNFSIEGSDRFYSTLSFDLLFKTNQKLVLVDEKGDLALGTGGKSIEKHVLRFKATMESGAGNLKFIKFVYALSKSMVGLFDVEKAEWFISNSDDSIYIVLNFLYIIMYLN
jgi:hypothetical protein